MSRFKVEIPLASQFEYMVPSPLPDYYFDTFVEVMEFLEGEEVDNRRALFEKIFAENGKIFYDPVIFITKQLSKKIYKTFHFALGCDKICYDIYYRFCFKFESLWDYENKGVLEEFIGYYEYGLGEVELSEQSGLGDYYDEEYIVWFLREELEEKQKKLESASEQDRAEIESYINMLNKSIMEMTENE